MANPTIDNNADAVLADYMRRSDAGETIDREAFVAAHPQVAEELREYFASVDDVERMAGPPLASTVQNGIKAAETHVSSVGDSVSEKPARQTQSANFTSTDTLPETFGRYRIEKRLGRGAMGAVYLAQDTQLDRRVALKTPTFDTDADADMVERFYREARAAANLRHAGICPIFDVGKIDDTHYISMAYIEGKPMSALVDVDKPIPIRSVVSLVRKIALALDHAHSQGVIHRDLKPANIMIDKQKQPLIMDFGLARRVDKHEQTRLTQDGIILGTPAYMSPEQVEGNLESGKQSDVYSLGVILYELLTGDLPFQGTVAAVIGQIMTQDAPAPSSERAEIDPALDAICQKMMARKLEDRYAGTKDAAEALTDYLKGKANRSPASQTPATQTVTADEGLAAFLETASKDEFPAVKTRRDGTLTQIVAPWKKLPSRTKVIATSALAGLLLLMGVIVMIRTPYGTVRVEVAGNEDVEVLVGGDTVKLTDQKWKEGEHRLALKLGGQQLAFDTNTKQFKFDEGVVEVTVGGAKLTSQKFEVVRGERTVLGIEVIRRTGTPPHDPADSPPSPSPLDALRAPQLVSRFDHDATTRKQCYLSHLSADAARVAYRMQWKASMQMFETTSRKVVPLPELLQTAMTMDDNADGSLLATGHTDGTVRLWNSRTLEPVGQPFVTTAGFFVRWVSLSDDGKTLLALPSGQPPKFYAWDIESRESITEPFALGDDNKVKGVHAAASADNLLLAVAYYEKDEDSQHFVELWDVKTGKPRNTRFEPNPGSQGTIYGIDLSPSGDRLAIAGKHGNGFVFDTATGKQTMNALHGGRVFSARFSPDGRQLATCGGPADSEDMHLWDLETGEELVRWKLPRDAKSVRTDQFGAQTSFLVYSRDGSRLLTSGMNTPVCVWNLKPTSQTAAETNAATEFSRVFTHPGGYFIQGRDKDWFQKWDDGGKPPNLFREVDRTAEYIELRHRLVRVTFRLYRDRSEIKDERKPRARFVKRYGGKWVTPTAVTDTSRSLWVQPHGYFLQGPGKDWLESWDDGKKEPNLFEEVQRTDEFVELKHRHLKVLFRLYADRALGKSARRNENDFVLRYTGAWQNSLAGGTAPASTQLNDSSPSETNENSTNTPVPSEPPEQLKKLEETIFPWLVWVQAEGDQRKPIAVATAKGVCCVYPGGFKKVEISSLDLKQKVAGTVGSRGPFPFCWIDPAMPRAGGMPLAAAGSHRRPQPGVIVMREDGKPVLQTGTVNADGTFTPVKPYNPPNQGVAAPGPIFNTAGECLGYGVRLKAGQPIKIYPLQRQ